MNKPELIERLQNGLEEDFEMRMKYGEQEDNHFGLWSFYYWLAGF